MKALLILAAISLPITAFANQQEIQLSQNFKSARGVVQLSNQETADLLETTTSEQGCFPFYEAKLKRIHDHRVIREIGKDTVIVAGVALCALGPVPAANLLVGTAYEGFVWIYDFAGIAVRAKGADQRG